MSIKTELYGELEGKYFCFSRSLPSTQSRWLLIDLFFSFSLLKIYFCGSIRGGREDTLLYKEVIAYMRQTCDVLTEHIGDENLIARSEGLEADQKIYQRDVTWLKEADLVVAEVTVPSLGRAAEKSPPKGHLYQLILTTSFPHRCRL